MTDIHLADTLGQYADKKETVLSEGEAHIISLARFFTDAYFDDSCASLVLDDPVSSLDNINRKRIVNHLCEFAKERQVIVFTHDQAFVIALRRGAPNAGIPVTERSIVRTLSTEQPGEVLNQHEFSATAIKARLINLDDALNNLRADYKADQRKAYLSGLAVWAGGFSVLLEEMIKVDLVGRVVDQDSMEVHPRMLRLFAKFSNEEHQEFQWLYSEATEKLERHAKDPRTHGGPVKPDDLAEILRRARKWRQKISQLAEQA